MLACCTTGHIVPQMTVCLANKPSEQPDARLVGEAMAEAGCQAHLAVVENAVQAFEYLSARGRFADVLAPHLILLDLNLPIIGGHQALSVIRSHAQWKDLPVWMFTSSLQQSDRHVSEALGARFMTKPANWRGYVEWAGRLRDALAGPAPQPGSLPE